MTTRLIGFEAAALRYANSLPDDELAGVLADLIDRVAVTIDDGLRPQDFRELAAAALITARRLEGRA